MSMSHKSASFGSLCRFNGIEIVRTIDGMKISVCSLKVQLTLVSEIKEMEILMSIFHLLLKARVENVGDSTFGLGFHVVRMTLCP